MTNILVPVSPGELLDKVTILRIKSQRMSDPAKLANVRRELDLLRATWSASRTTASAGSGGTGRTRPSVMASGLLGSSRSRQPRTMVSESSAPHRSPSA